MAREYDEVVKVLVDQQTISLSEPSFSTAAVISLFDEADIPGWAADQRAKVYAEDQELADDGFAVDSLARVGFNNIASQTPRRVENVLIGREDSADASMSETANAIANENPDFLDVHYRIERTAVLTMSEDFVADNAIDIQVVTGDNTFKSIPTVAFDTDNATTYDAIEAAIELAIPGSVVVVDEAARTVSVNVPGKVVLQILVAVTGGAVQVITMSAAFITDNDIATTVAFGTGTNANTEVLVPSVPFDTDNATTYTNWEAAIALAVSGSVVVGDEAAKTMTITMAAQDRVLATVVVTNGVTQATASVVNSSPTTGTSSVVALDTAEDNKFRQLGTWVLANERIFGYSDDNTSASSSPYDSGLATQPDLGSYFKSTTNERAYGIFDKATPGSELDGAWAGENLPYGPAMDGKLNTWSFKQPKGTNIAPRSYTTDERANLDSKNYNVYTAKRGTGLTLNNYTGTREPIEAIINRDWTVYLIQNKVFTLLLQKRAVPLNDNGMLTVVGQIADAMGEAETKGAIVPGSTVITYPRFADLPEADRNAGIFSGIQVAAKIQRATQKVNVLFIITA